MRVKDIIKLINKDSGLYIKEKIIINCFGMSKMTNNKEYQ